MTDTEEGTGGTKWSWYKMYVFGGLLFFGMFWFTSVNDPWGSSVVLETVFIVLAPFVLIIINSYANYMESDYNSYEEYVKDNHSMEDMEPNFPIPPEP